MNILVGRKKIEWIAHNHIISEHAKLQLMRRGAGNLDLKRAILNNPLAWKLESGCIAIAINLYSYIIVGNNPETTIVTYIDLKESKYSVVDKMLMDYQDLLRGSKND